MKPRKKINYRFYLLQMSLNGKCVSDHENAIDYGDGFLRRTGSVEVETYVKKSGYQKTSSTTRLDSPQTGLRQRLACGPRHSPPK